MRTGFPIYVTAFMISEILFCMVKKVVMRLTQGSGGSYSVYGKGWYVEEI